MSILPVRSLAGLVAVGHDLAASALEELLALLWPRPAQPAGLPLFLSNSVERSHAPGFDPGQGGVSKFSFLVFDTARPV